MLPKRLRFILDRSVTVATLLDRAVAGREDEIFFTTDSPLPQYDIPDEGLTGEGLRVTVNRLCNILQDRGVGRFDRVAVWKRTGLDYFLWSLATMRRGAISVPVNGRMPPQNFLRFAAHCGARIIVTDSEGMHLLLTSGQSLDGIEQIIVTDGKMHVPGLQVTALTDVFAAAATEFDPPHMDRDQHVMICHTSGTTGLPKGVLHGSDSFICAAKGQLKIQFITRKNPIVFAGWMNHHISQAGCLTSLAAGVRTHIPTDLSPETLLRTIAERKPHLFFAFPDIYQGMCHARPERFDLGSIRMWMTSGDAMHERFIRQLVSHGAFLRLFGRPVIGSLFMEFFGTSEIGFAALVKISERRTKSYARLVGRPTPASPAVRIGDAEGRTLPAHTVGRLMVKGSTLFKGYWNHHDRAQDVIRDGWWWTGDVGYRDSYGRFYQLDRDVDTVLTAQGPVYGLPVEEEALKLPGVLEATLLADPQINGADHAIVMLQMQPEATPDAGKLLADLKTACPWARHVAAIRFTPRGEAPPRGLTGKVLKRELRARPASPVAPAPQKDLEHA